MAIPTHAETPQSPDLLECPVDRAIYRMKMAPEYSCGFARQDPRKAARYDLIFWLKTPRRTYYFSFHEPRWREGDYRYQGPYIVPDIDPKRAAKLDDYTVTEHPDWIRRAEPIEFDTFSHEMYAWGVPVSFNPAPSYIFVRGIGPVLWREPWLLTLGEGKAEPEEMPLGMFELVECAAEPH